MTTALEGVRGQRHAPAAHYPRKRPGTQGSRTWLPALGPRADLDRCKKSRPPPGCFFFGPRFYCSIQSICYICL